MIYSIMEKAFDRINHNLDFIIKKLKLYEFTERLLLVLLTLSFLVVLLK